MRSYLLAHLTLFTCAQLLYLSFGVVADADELLNDFVQFGKEFLEKVLTQWRLPQLVNNVKEAPCASCHLGVPREALAGAWTIVMISQNLMSSKFAELDRVLARLERNQPVSSQKTFMEWISGAPEMRCAQLTVLDSMDVTKYEIGYRLAATGRQRTVIGNWHRDETGTYNWELPAPISSMRLCISHHGYLESEAKPLNQLRNTIWPAETNGQGVFSPYSSQVSQINGGVIVDNLPAGLTTESPLRQAIGPTESEANKQQIEQIATLQSTTSKPEELTHLDNSQFSSTSSRSEIEEATVIAVESLNSIPNSSQIVFNNESVIQVKADNRNELFPRTPASISFENVTSCPEIAAKLPDYDKVVGVGAVAESDGNLLNRQIETKNILIYSQQKTTPPITIATVRNATDGEENATVRLSSEITKTRLSGHRKCANRTKGSIRRKQRMALPLSQPLASQVPILPAVRWPLSQPPAHPQSQMYVDGLNRNLVGMSKSEPLTSRILPESLFSTDVHQTAAALTQFLVLNQVDSSPMPCDNYIVLARLATPLGSEQSLAKIAQIREFLERERVESIFNKLERIHCY